jgi:hypothetical protein
VPAGADDVWRSTVPAAEVVLRDGALRLPLRARPGRPARVPAVALRATAPASPGAAGRATLVLAEPADPAWRATLGGHPLRPAPPADGWAQAWQWPAGGAGRLSIVRTGDHRSTVVAVELVLVLAAALLALPPLPTRRRAVAR